MNTGVSPEAGPITPPPILTPACRKCGTLVDQTFVFCPRCGQRLNPGAAWYYEPVWILVLAFLALGPLALILVWKSPKMGPLAKTLMAAAIIVYTGYTGYYLYWLTALELKQLQEFNSIMLQLR